MKKLLNLSFGYALAGMAGGVFYREFTKFNEFTGRTSLGVVHTHLLMLGCVMFLLAALFAAQIPVTAQKPYRAFLICYNAGVVWTAFLLLVRGVLQVLGTPLSGGADAAVSGMAGIGHILLGIGLVLLFICLRRAAGEKEA